MPDFERNENIKLYQKLIAENESAAPRDQGRHATLLKKLFADEIAKQRLPQSSKKLAS
jgi:hypothetical protein